jgi:hypothetical protein
MQVRSNTLPPSRLVAALVAYTLLLSVLIDLREDADRQDGQSLCALGARVSTGIVAYLALSCVLKLDHARRRVVGLHRGCQAE